MEKQEVTKVSGSAYTGPARLRSNISLLQGLALVEVTGEDAGRLLQGQVTVNVEPIQNQELQLAAMCNPKGRCISLFLLAKTQQGYGLFMAKDLVDSCIGNLKKYGVFYKVEIVEKTEHYAIYGGFDISDDQPLATEITKTAGGKVFYWQKEQISMILLDKTSLTENLSDSLQTKHQLPELLHNASDDAQWLYRLTQARIPWLTLPVTSHFLPHNLALPELAAVDFKKGCFTGQEVIARMQYKGKLKSHMQLFETDSEIQVKPGEFLYIEDKAVAEVISGAKGDNGRSAILALVKDKDLSSEKFRLYAQNGPIISLTSKI